MTKRLKLTRKQSTAVSLALIELDAIMGPNIFLR